MFLNTFLNIVDKLQSSPEHNCEAVAVETAELDAVAVEGEVAHPNAPHLRSRGLDHLGGHLQGILATFFKNVSNFNNISQ